MNEKMTKETFMARYKAEQELKRLECSKEINDKYAKRFKERHFDKDVDDYVYSRQGKLKHDRKISYGCAMKLH